MGYFDQSYPAYLWTPVPLSGVVIAGLTVTVTAPLQSGVSAIHWGDGGAPVRYTSPATHTYAAAGTYTITLDPDAHGAKMTTNVVLI
jgi:hypothetical protein